MPNALERIPQRPRPSNRLILLWLINGGTLAGIVWETPVLGLAAFSATLALVASYLHWKYRRILEPARRVALAFARNHGPLGEACRDLSEAILLWDVGAKR